MSALTCFALGDLTIYRIVELEAPFLMPGDVFTEATADKIAPHRHWLEPKALCPKTGKLILPVQSYLIKTRHHTILIDTCIGCRKTYDGIPGWNDRRDETWLHNLNAAGFALTDITHVFCTHLHVDHCGWNTQKINGRWTPSFPKAQYLFARQEYAWFETLDNVVFRENVLPVVEAGQAKIVDHDFQLDDNIWLTPTPGHTKGHVAVNIASQGQQAMMIGDLMHTPLQLAYPDWSPHFDYDLTQSRHSRREMLECHCDTDCLILTAHLPSPSVGHVTYHKKRDFDFRYMASS